MKESKNEKRAADADYLQSIITEARNESDANEILDGIHELLPQLKQCNDELNVSIGKVGSTNTIMEKQLQWCNDMNNQLKIRYNELIRKIDSINSHIDKVIADAPQKLVITVAVSEKDRAAIQAEYDRTIQVIKNQHQKHMKEIRDTSGSGNVLYISGAMYWFGVSFFLIGVVMSILPVVYWINWLIQ